LVWGSLDEAYGFIDDSFFGMDMNGNMIPDSYLFNGLLDPRLIGDAAFQVDDHSRVVRAFANGRLDNGADTDVFMFVPQVDMLGSFEGSDRPDTRAMRAMHRGRCGRRTAGLRRG
jgi:hypothetical protein